MIKIYGTSATSIVIEHKHRTEVVNIFEGSVVFIEIEGETKNRESYQLSIELEYAAGIMDTWNLRLETQGSDENEKRRNWPIPMSIKVGKWGAELSIKLPAESVSLDVGTTNAQVDLSQSRFDADPTPPAVVGRPSNSESNISA
jgi:hypothetical protein